MAEFVVGPGVEQAMQENGDVPCSDELYIVLKPGARISQTFGQQGIYYWLEVQNAVNRVPF